MELAPDITEELETDKAICIGLKEPLDGNKSNALSMCIDICKIIHLKLARQQLWTEQVDKV